MDPLRLWRVPLAKGDKGSRIAWLKHQHPAYATVPVGGKFELEDRWLGGLRQRCDADDSDGFPSWSDKVCFCFSLNRVKSLLAIAPDVAGFSWAQLHPRERQ